MTNIQEINAYNVYDRGITHISWIFSIGFIKTIKIEYGYQKLWILFNQ